MAKKDAASFPNAPATEQKWHLNRTNMENTIYHKIVLAGGNGYLGGILATYYKHLANEIIVLA
jgi:hypothetical protein